MKFVPTTDKGLSTERLLVEGSRSVLSWGTGVLALFAVLGLASPAQAELSVEIVAPAADALTCGSTTVRATAISSQAVKALTISGGGATTDLVYDSDTQEYQGMLTLPAIPFGQVDMLTATITDTSGNKATHTVSTRRDCPPQMTLEGIDDDDVFRERRQSLTLSCKDDDPAGCKSATILAGDTVIAEGDSIPAFFDLPADRDGSAFRLRFVMSDSGGNTREITRYVHLETSPNVAMVEKWPGRILDIAHGKVLLAKPNVLTLKDMTTDVDIVFDGAKALQKPSDIGWARVYTAGVVYTESKRGIGKDGNGSGTLFKQASGGLKEKKKIGFLGRAGQSTVAGNYVVSDLSLDKRVRYNLMTDDEDEVAGPFRQDASDIDVDGTLCVTGRVTQFGNNQPMFRILVGAGQSMVQPKEADVIPALYSDYVHVGCRLEGTRSLYGRANATNFFDNLGATSAMFSIVMNDGTSETVLAEGISLPKVSVFEEALIEGGEIDALYRLAGGWVAFVRPDKFGALNVWRRSPAGTAEQISSFGTTTRVDSLSDGGDLTFINSGRRYAAVGTEPPVAIGGTNGRVFWIDGELRLAIGNALFRVEENAKPPGDAGPTDAGPTDAGPADASDGSVSTIGDGGSAADTGSDGGNAGPSDDGGGCSLSQGARLENRRGVGLMWLSLLTISLFFIFRKRDAREAPER